MSWIDLLALAAFPVENEPDSFYMDRNMSDRDRLSDALHNAADIAHRDKQVWRMTTLLKADLNEHKNKPGDKGSNQAQVRVIAEGIHNDLFRRFNGMLPRIDVVLDRAESSLKDRKGFLEAVLTPTLQKQYELLIKLAL